MCTFRSKRISRPTSALAKPMVFQAIPDSFNEILDNAHTSLSGYVHLQPAFGFHKNQEVMGNVFESLGKTVDCRNEPHGFIKPAKVKPVVQWVPQKL